MTSRADIKQLKFKEFEDLCREHGIAKTWQRRMVLDTLLDRADHPTADQVYEDVQRKIPGVSRTTIYRVLDALVRLGVVVRVSHPGAAARFDVDTSPHHHLLCTVCGTLIDLEASAVEISRLAHPLPKGFEISDYSVYFRGVCTQCRLAGSNNELLT